MTIDRNTRLTDIFSACPEARAELPTINERLKMINSPLARVMLRNATVAEMSQRSGMDEELLVSRLNSLVSYLNIRLLQ